MWVCSSLSHRTWHPVTWPSIILTAEWPQRRRILLAGWVHRCTHSRKRQRHKGDNVSRLLTVIFTMVGRGRQAGPRVKQERKNDGSSHRHPHRLLPSRGRWTKWPPLRPQGETKGGNEYFRSGGSKDLAQRIKNKIPLEHSMMKCRNNSCFFLAKICKLLPLLHSLSYSSFCYCFSS